MCNFRQQISQPGLHDIAHVAVTTEDSNDIGLQRAFATGQIDTFDDFIIVDLAALECQQGADSRGTAMVTGLRIKRDPGQFDAGREATGSVAE